VAVALPAGRAVTLHAEPIVWTLRLYDEPDGYVRRVPYPTVVTAMLMGDRALLSGLHGSFDRQAWRAIEEWLRSRGVTQAAMERHGRIVTLTDEDGAHEAISEAAEG